jgi:hypothetical protein
MKRQLYTLVVIIVMLVACKKESGVNEQSEKNEKPYLLSAIISGNDTSRFLYNNKNQLIKWTTGPFTIADSFIYNGSDQLTSFRYQYRTNAGSSFATIVCTYNNDTILEAVTDAATPQYSRVKRYSLLNNRIVKSEETWEQNGIITFPGSPFPSYWYSNSNIVRCVRPWVTQGYQPVDTFQYHREFVNPYLSLGNHVWTLLNYINVTSKDLIQGESSNLPAVESYANYVVSDTVLTFSGMNTYRTIVLQEAEENKMLPKMIIRTNDGGIEQRLTFAYIKGM